MTGLLYRLGRLCVRRRWIVLGVWLRDLRGAGRLGAQRSAPTSTTTSRCPAPTARPRPTCSRSASRRRRTAPTRSSLRAPKGEQDHRLEVQAADRRHGQRRSRTTRTSASATSPLSSSGASLLAKDKHDRLHRAEPASRARASSRSTTRSGSSRSPIRRAKAGLEVGFGGYLGQKVSKPETHISEVIGLGMAVIVLLFTFGTVVAMGLPIITAIFGLVCGLSIITLLSHVVGGARPSRRRWRR